MDTGAIPVLLFITSPCLHLVVEILIPYGKSSLDNQPFSYSWVDIPCDVTFKASIVNT